MTITDWCSPDDLEHSTSGLAPAAVRLASRILFSLTGRIYGGEKSVTETYLPQTLSGDPIVSETLLAYGIGQVCRVSPYRVGVAGELRIPLRRRPVRAIEQLTVTRTGEVVPPGHYDVTTATYLTLDATVPSMMGLTVAYLYGTNPPEDGVAAAIALADELVMLFGGDEDAVECSRLRNVTSLTRQGVSIEIEDAKSILTDGRVGIPEVDLFVASVNPGKARQRSRVFSPDSFTAR